MIKTSIDIISDMLGGMFEGIEGLFEKDHSLGAEFGAEQELLSPWNKGFSVTGKKQLSIEDSRNNMIIVSPSGGGKTTTVIYPSIFKIESSMLINDPSGELSKATNYLRSKGFTVKTLNFGNKEESLYYNPLHRINNRSDVNKVSTMLVKANAKNEKIDFWQQKSVEVISLLISFLIETQPRIYQNLSNTFRLLEEMSANPKKVDTLFADKAPDYLWLKYKSLKGNSEKTLSSIISSAQASLSFIGNDENLSSLTSVDTFNFDDMRKEKTVVFLRSPLGDAYYNTILSIFFEQFFQHQFKSLPKEDHDDIFIIIDELSSLHLPNFANIISNSRKYRIPILGVLQSENQLFENFGQYNAKTILNNASTKVYFSGLTDESVRLEKVLGMYEYEDKKGQRRTRSLMTADQIRTMPKNKVLIIPNAQKPIYAKVTAHYKQRKMMRYLAMETDTTLEPQNPNYTIQYLSLEKKDIKNEKQDKNNYAR